MPAPEPPSSVGRHRPSRSAWRNASKTSWGYSPVVSISRARGLIRSWARRRTESWRAASSGERSKSTKHEATRGGSVAGSAGGAVGGTVRRAEGAPGRPAPAQGSRNPRGSPTSRGQPCASKCSAHWPRPVARKPVEVGGDVRPRVPRAPAREHGQERVDPGVRAGDRVAPPRRQHVEGVVDHVRVVGGDVVLLVGIGGQVEQEHFGEPVKGVVIGPDADPAVEPHRALGGPCRVGEDQVLASGRSGGGEVGGEGGAVPTGGHLGTGQVEHGRHQVDLVVEAFVDTPRLLRPGRAT